AAAAWLLGGLGGNDLGDGWGGRRHHQVREFGKVLDPARDSILFVGAPSAIIIDGCAPRWFCILVLARELAVGITVAVATLFWHMQRFDVTWLGKLAPLLLMFAIPGFSFGS